jgi:hypothetical protein
VKAPGRPDRPYEVTLVEGAREVLTVEPGIDPAAAPRDPKLPERARGEDRGPRIAPSIGVGAATPSPDRPGVDADAAAGNPRRTAGFVVGGVGVVSLVVGATTGLLAFSKKSEVDSLCPRSDVCSAEGIAAESTGKSLATASTITVVVGLVAASAGAALVLTSGGGSEPRPSAAIAPLVLPGGAGLGAFGRF